MTNDLHRFCNGTAWNRPRLLELRPVINIMGFGASVIARLLQTSIRKNLFYTIKDKVIEERIVGSAIHKRTQKTKVFGSDSTKAERENLMEILRDRVEYHKDKIISPTIYEELCGLEVKKNGKIEHSSNTHDDQVFSWLWALYVYYNGGDLMNNWGITKRVLRTDADLEEAVLDINEDSSEVATNLDATDNEEVQEAVEIMENAPGKLLYEQWMQQERRNDEECMTRLLSDKAVQASISDRYKMMIPQMSSQVQTIPNEVFDNFYTDEFDQRNTNSVLVGNLSQFMK